MSTILIFLVVIIFLVVAHELGHFFVAKAFHVRVDEFGIGYPPRAKKLFTWRGTLFTLNWLPFGGFVKIFGEDNMTEGEKADSFAYKSRTKRVLIIAAGIIANMVIGIILYSISFGVGFLASPTDFPGSVPLGPSEMLVTNVVDKSPASEAGLNAGDVITSLSVGTEKSSDILSVENVIGFIHAHPDQAITIDLLHSGDARTVVVTPKIGVVGSEPGIGVGLAVAAPIRLPFFQAIVTGTKYAFQEFVSIIHSLGVLVVGIFQGNKALLSQVSGPVGIAQIAGQAYALGFGSFLSFVALISINLAVINLLPFPALDGGRLILELFASKGKSRIPAKVVSVVNQVGFLVLILLMLFVTYHDIRHLFI